MLNLNNYYQSYIGLFLYLIISFSTSSTVPPVAVFHGIGDLCSLQPMIEFVNYLKAKLQTEVKCIEQGNGLMTSWLTKLETQAEMACESIKNDPIFNDKEISIVGFSQGALLARYIIQKCEFKGKVKNFISISAPHMGSSILPRLNCGWFCNVLNKSAAKIIYFKFVQNNFAPAGYFKDTNNIKNYEEFSSFLADLNNEKLSKNISYKNKIMQLDKLLLIMNETDNIINPPCSAWFEYYDESNSKVIPLKDSRFYQEDYIGIKELDSQGKIQFVKLNNLDNYFSDFDIDTYIIPILN